MTNSPRDGKMLPDRRKAYRGLIAAYRLKCLFHKDLRNKMNSDKRDSMTASEKEVAEFYENRRMERALTLLKADGDFPATSEN